MKYKKVYLKIFKITSFKTTSCVESGMDWHAKKPGLTIPLDQFFPASVQNRDNTVICLI